MRPISAVRGGWASAVWMRGACFGLCAGLAFSLPAQQDAAEDFHRVVSLVQKRYVQPVSSSELYEKAIAGMLGRLDGRSAYLSPEAYAAMQEDKQGEYAGIGIVADKQGDSAFVHEVGADLPAARAGLREGDRILEIDGRPTRDMDTGAVAAAIRGSGEGDVRLVWMSGERRRQAAIRRAPIATPSVRSAVIPPAAGEVGPLLVLRIGEFNAPTAREVAERLAAAGSGRPAGLILDLRGNPGGLVDAAVDVASLFLPAGLTVLQVKRRDSGESLRTHPAAGLTAALEGVPMAVLVDAQTASAAEILAAALAEHGRAALIGGQTYGKGSIQTLIPLGERGAIKLTTAYYLTPKGETVEKVGIRPTVTVDGENNGKNEMPRERRFERGIVLSADDTALAVAARYLRIHRDPAL